MGGRTEEPKRGPDGARRGARWRARRSQTGPDEGPDEGPDKARRGGGRKDYLFLKEKMTCSVYVSCKSSSAFDVSDAMWL
jgi:hypothetical protein